MVHLRSFSFPTFEWIRLCAGARPLQAAAVAVKATQPERVSSLKIENTNILLTLKFFMPLISVVFIVFSPISSCFYAPTQRNISKMNLEQFLGLFLPKIAQI